jgi:hypothetical protein
LPASVLPLVAAARERDRLARIMLGPPVADHWEAQR